jgi:hypothetical protein
MCFITASTFVTTIFLQLFACRAPGNFFKFGDAGCHTTRDLYLSNLVFLFSAGTDIAGDVLLLMIPFPLLWKLQVNDRQKAILTGIFLLPLIPITFGILRLVFCNPTNGTVNVIKFTFYSMLENTAGKCLLKHYFKRMLKTGSYHNCLSTIDETLLCQSYWQYHSSDRRSIHSEQIQQETFNLRFSFRRTRQKRRYPTRFGGRGE